jgi:[ribosomal protein S5]-alanine N-acetyltransferase
MRSGQAVSKGSVSIVKHPIETERLIIRKFEPDDWRDLFVYASDATVMHYMAEGVLTTEAQAKSFIEKNIGGEAECFPVLLKANNNLIGHMVFHLWFGPRTYELGWVFHPAHQRKGYATEAAQALLKYSFEVLNAHRVIATCQPENPASYRVMEKIGMRREGHFRKCIHRHDDASGEVWWDEYFYAILEEEWFGRLQQRASANPPEG